MYLPKSEIYNSLKELPCAVIQTAQAVFNEFPVVTFEVLNNSTSLFLDNSISSQDISVKIDIWAESSPEASNLLSSIEEIMRSNHYRLDFSGDVPNIDNEIFHISTRFIKKI